MCSTKPWTPTAASYSSQFGARGEPRRQAFFHFVLQAAVAGRNLMSGLLRPVDFHRVVAGVGAAAGVEGAVMEAAEGGVRFIAVITEGVPAQDEARYYNRLLEDFPDVRLLGPNCP